MNSNEQDKPKRKPLTVEEWADEMRISRASAYAAVKNKEVKSIRIGRLIRIPASEVA